MERLPSFYLTILLASFSPKVSALDQLLIITSGGIADTFRVTGVLKPYKNPSQLDAGFYMGMNNKGWGKIINDIQSWAQTFIYSFVKLRAETSVEDLTAKMPALMEKHGAKELKAMGFTYYTCPSALERYAPLLCPGVYQQFSSD